MSVRSQLEAELAAIFAGSDPETVTRWPRGVEGAAVSVKAFWEPDETPERDASQDGERVTLGGVLRVLHTVDVDTEDVWVIDDERYSTLAVSPPHAGHKTVTVTRVEARTVGRNYGRL